jgi:flagellum-specific peptidoglycan hydrolase FlgJ
MKRTGVPASVTLAQAALETGWGGSSIGDAKNLFGIKGTGPAGSIRVSTKEFINGRMVTIQDNFRKYHSWAQSIEDHGRLLQNARYSPAMKYKNNPDQFAREIHKAGYATDPNYSSKLIGIMKANNFYQWDK